MEGEREPKDSARPVSRSMEERSERSAVSTFPRMAESRRGAAKNAAAAMSAAAIAAWDARPILVLLVRSTISQPP